MVVAERRVYAASWTTILRGPDQLAASLPTSTVQQPHLTQQICLSRFAAAAPLR